MNTIHLKRFGSQHDTVWTIPHQERHYILLEHDLTTSLLDQCLDQVHIPATDHITTIYMSLQRILATKALQAPADHRGPFEDVRASNIRNAEGRRHGDGHTTAHPLIMVHLSLVGLHMAPQVRRAASGGRVAANRALARVVAED